NLERLYNLVPFLKKTNERFSKEKSKSQLDKEKKDRQKAREEARKKKEEEEKARAEAKAKGLDPDADKKSENQKKSLPKNSKGFEKEIALLPDSTIEVQHGKNTKRFRLTAKTENGKTFEVKYKRIDENKIKVWMPKSVSKQLKIEEMAAQKAIRDSLRSLNPEMPDSLFEPLVAQHLTPSSPTKIKLSLMPKEPLDEKGWYKTTQSIARLLMMVRNVSLTYRNTYSMSLPGFMPTVGKAFGQRRDGGILAPGLDFAFGFTGDSYLEKARENGWLLSNESIATPATTNRTEDLQLRATLEPVRNFKIDLNASRSQNTAKSIQYMYAGNPTTQSGTFTMTTLSIGSAFEGTGNASNGYRSKSFEKFVASLDGFRDRVEAQYHGTTYPAGTTLAGKTFDPANGTVDKYSADVMIPAFLATYTSMGGGSLDIFPALTRLLPNWTIRYSGLGKLPWFRDHFKSVNINHSYKSIYAVGAYSSYSTFMSIMNPNAMEGMLGFVSNATTNAPIPSSMYNVSSVSINESFSPLLGVDVTLQNNMTVKLEYRSTRVLNLSMTSVQINEATSNDWVVGMGYKINDLKLFGGRNHRAVRGSKKGQNDDGGSTQNVRGKTTTNNALNLRLDLSYRRQANITRDIATLTSSASSGNSAFKLSFAADYTLSKLLTMTFYFDRQTNTPLLSSSSYPTTTQDFGLSLKLSLTR
ncbi:MAG: cell surface protein SprA, partial [Prevotella sp.]|nr:cell surface protein SprA [Prevotella sp.]